MFGFHISCGVLQKYYGFNPDVVIPDTVECIAKKAFQDNTRIKTVEIPDSVTEIESGAFWGCTGLYEVTLPEGLTEIGANTFYDCEELEEIKLPSSLKKIGSYAFHHSGLTSIAVPQSVTCIERCAFNVKGSLEFALIPDSVTEIGERAFGEDPDTVIHTDRNSAGERYGKRYGMTVVCFEDVFERLEEENNRQQDRKKPVPPPTFTIKGNRLTYCMGDSPVIRIPEGVTVIGKSALMGKRIITELYLPDSVTTIEEKAFSCCINLKTVHFSNRLVTVGKRAFHNCGLTDLRLPASVRSVEVAAFSYCPGLTSVQLPDCPMTIDLSSFIGCRNLKHLYIPGSVTVDNPLFFNHPSGLTIHTAENSTAHDAAIFQNIPCVTTGPAVIRKEDFEIQGTVLKKYNGNRPNVVIPEGITEIGKEAFKNNSTLINVTLPDSVVRLGESAFSSCNRLSGIVLPDGINCIPTGAFYWCSSLRSVTFPKKLETIQCSAFTGCGLVSVTFPGSLRSIAGSFSSCFLLDAATLPATVTHISQEAFQNCPRLTLYAPEGSAVCRYARKNGIKFSSGVYTPSKRQLSPAPPSTALPGGISRTYYDRLNNDQKHLYVAILDALYRMDNHINLPTNKTRPGSFALVRTALKTDYPDLFWVDWHRFNSLRELSSSYWISREEKQRRQKAIEQAVAPFLSRPHSHLNDYEKARAALDWLINHMEYDHEGLDEEKKNGSKRPDDLRTIYGAFCKKKAVCVGYAVALQYLFQHMGLESIQYTGSNYSHSKDSNHAWTMVKLEGQYYHVDATWNDTDRSDLYPFFCNTDQDMLCVWDHLDNYHSLPVANSKECNYYTKEGIYFEEMNEDLMLQRLRQYLQRKHPKRLHFRVDRISYQEVSDFVKSQPFIDLMKEFGMSEHPQPYHDRFGVYYIV